MVAAVTVTDAIEGMKSIYRAGGIAVIIPVIGFLGSWLSGSMLLLDYIHVLLGAIEGMKNSIVGISRFDPSSLSRLDRPLITNEKKSPITRSMPVQADPAMTWKYSRK